MTWEWVDIGAGFIFASAIWFAYVSRMNHLNTEREAKDRATIFTLRQDLEDALDGKQPAAWLESAGVDLVVKERPWDAVYDGPFKDIRDLTGVKEDNEP